MNDHQHEVLHTVLRQTIIISTNFCSDDSVILWTLVVLYVSVGENKLVSLLPLPLQHTHVTGRFNQELLRLMVVIHWG